MILFLQSYEKELKHGCYIHFRAAIICSFADISVPLQPRVGPIVQWIERRFPKPLIRVRFPVEVQSIWKVFIYYDPLFTVTYRF